MRSTEALVAKNKTLRAPLADLQMNTISDAIPTGLLDLRYRRCSFHCSTPLATTQEAQSITRLWNLLEEQSATCGLFMWAYVSLTTRYWKRVQAAERAFVSCPRPMSLGAGAPARCRKTKSQPWLPQGGAAGAAWRQKPRSVHGLA